MMRRVVIGVLLLACSKTTTSSPPSRANETTVATEAPVALVPPPPAGVIIPRGVKLVALHTRQDVPHASFLWKATFAPDPKSALIAQRIAAAANGKPLSPLQAAVELYRDDVAATGLAVDGFAFEAIALDYLVKSPAESFAVFVRPGEQAETFDLSVTTPGG